VTIGLYIIGPAVSDDEEQLLLEQAEYQHQLRNTGSNRSLEQAQKWILNCVQKHETCAQRGMERVLPTRLLYIGTHEDQSVRLCETTTWLPGTLDQYTTLSHCWGKIPMIRLLKENITRFQSDIAFEYLPKTFQDAIHVTRFLGISYIWIDSLCIIQDSTDDWQKESLNMVDIYSNSYRTIAATKASDGSKGCFTERSPWSCPIFFKVPTLSSGSQPVLDDTGRDLQQRTLSSRSYRFHWEHLWEDEITKSPLLQRAWVFQERVLSPRVLHFAQSHIFFECRETTVCQAYPDGIPQTARSRIPGMGKKPDFECQNSMDIHILKKGVFLAWDRSVSAYSRCDITHEEDRFIAIAGIARRLQPLLGCRYIAGLWEFQLARQLTWYKNRPAGSSITKTTPSSPSWTWLSNLEAGSRNNLIYRSQNIGPCDMKVEGAHIVTIDGSEFSQVVSGSLRVTARLIPVQYNETSSEVEFRGIRRSAKLDIAITDLKVKLFCTICFYEEDGRKYPFYYVALLLRRTIGKRGFYHRVGRVAIHRGINGKDLLCRGEAMEKAEITEDCYEIYHEDIDKYTFTII
jgi:hypothetical protein